MNQLTAIAQEAIGKKLEQEANGKKIALIFHLKIKDYSAYQQWLIDSNKQFGGRNLSIVAKFTEMQG
ncbi:hypothetical protein H0A36_15715 [Endozoicomonas sp. SM1973]|uniref:Uncharacterized protein n=1 Tax=Spartinivicinus marinus TaxID=2994442 RepID=A0A853IBL9_9GAMM|nr:hypothetical protein [Spartinivicinus marinus]MCX4028423.1 hypothetical protein [Spartinivicinus marinus]NYZ67464.1 hypothetical protein [Spartinivicinus marinus]